MTARPITMQELFYIKTTSANIMVGGRNRTMGTVRTRIGAGVHEVIMSPQAYDDARNYALRGQCTVLPSRPNVVGRSNVSRDKPPLGRSGGDVRNGGCEGREADGTPCKFAPLHGKTYCFRHGEYWEDYPVKEGLEADSVPGVKHWGIYMNQNEGAVGFNNQYARPNNLVFVDLDSPWEVAEIKSLPNLLQVDEIYNDAPNVFVIMLKHYLERFDRRIRILFRREVGIGDILLTTIPIASLAKKYRDQIVIDFWAPHGPAQELLWYNPYIRQILDGTVKDPREIGDAFDIFIDLHKRVGNPDVIDYYEPEVYESYSWPNINMGRGEIWCKYFGVEPVASVPKVYLSPDEIETAGFLYRYNLKYPEQPTVGLATGATSNDKCLPIGKIKRIAEVLAEKGFNVFLIGTHEDIDGPFFNCNKLSLRTLCGLLKYVDVTMTYESMLGHLVAAAGSPQLCVYGRFDARQSMGKYPLTAFYGIHDEVDCPTGRPCWHKSRTPCKLECVREIHPDAVVKQIINHYERTRDVNKPR